MQTTEQNRFENLNFPKPMRGMEKYKPFIYNLDLEHLEAWLKEEGEPKFRAIQVMQWLNRGIRSAEEMTNLSKGLRQKMEETFEFDGLQMAKQLKSSLDPTTKYVFTLQDGNGLESVYMEYKHGTSVCLSSQVGCRMGCTFCASTGLGLARNLSAGELLAQVSRIAKDQGKRIDNIVVMGIGEPFENYTELVRFLKKVNDPKGLNIGMRHITVSTCGLVPEIKRLADDEIPITLAISLHAPTQEIRKQLMPVAARYSLEELMQAIRYYVDKTNRRITFEYAMFKGVNDTLECALALTKLLKNLHCHINLIPANEFEGGLFQRSTLAAIHQFQKILVDKGFSCTIRRELGRDISAACGQLRRQMKK